MAQPSIVVDVDKDEEADEAAYEPGWYSILRETAEGAAKADASQVPLAPISQ